MPNLDVDRLIAIVERVLAARGVTHPISHETAIDELPLSSVEVIEIFLELEEQTGCVVSESDLVQARNIGDLARVPCIDV